MNNLTAETSPQEKSDQIKTLPVIGITMGDPAGIGGEIIIKALSDGELNKICQPVIIGDGGFFSKVAENIGEKFEYIEVGKNEDFPLNSTLPILCNLDNLREDFPIGEESAVAGRASAEYIETAVQLWKEGKIDAITTAPINKKSINMGGYNFPGHTEFLAELTETEKFAMSFFTDKLRVVLLSTHVSLKDAIDLVKKERLVELIRFSHSELTKLLKKDVRIAVAGLNPHASEGGMFGTEESAEIQPAIEECREKHGIDVAGAFSPDTIFLRAYQGEFDGVISCYHDQATIAVKCLSFGAAVNVTLGLPLVRTSVDHGTAFDIAGKNLADASSMKAAIALAAKLTVN